MSLFKGGRKQELGWSKIEFKSIFKMLFNAVTMKLIKGDYFPDNPASVRVMNLGLID